VNATLAPFPVARRQIPGWESRNNRPALRVLHPLAVFMKHGRVNTELLVN
jgi:hypothetical protein